MPVRCRGVGQNQGPPGPPGPPGAGIASYSYEFGVRALAGSGANPRYLWPGSGRTIAQGELVGFPSVEEGLLRAFAVHQQAPPAAGAATITYTVLVADLPTAATIVLPVTSSVLTRIDGLSIPVPPGVRVSLRATRSADHSTVGDVTASVYIEESAP